MTELTLEHAHKLIQAARAHAESIGLKCTLAVVDSGGHLMALERMDGALLASLETAQVKARTSVYFGAPTRALPMDKPFTPALLGGVSYPLAFVPGGVPLKLEGRLVGGFAVGGGSSEQDEATVQAGLRVFEG